MIAALTTVPVLEANKVKLKVLIVTFNRSNIGIPVGTLAIGEDGTTNAGILATSIVANNNHQLKED